MACCSFPLLQPSLFLSSFSLSPASCTWETQYWQLLWLKDCFLTPGLLSFQGSILSKSVFGWPAWGRWHSFPNNLSSTWDIQQLDIPCPLWVVVHIASKQIRKLLDTIFISIFSIVLSYSTSHFAIPLFSCSLLFMLDIVVIPLLPNLWQILSQLLILTRFNLNTEFSASSGLAFWNYPVKINQRFFLKILGI